MDWKREVTEALDLAERERILLLAEQSLARTLRYVQMNIWGDARLLRRWRAVEALGWLTEARASAEDEAFRNLLRRSLWAMNDESGNVPWAAPEVMAAIIAARPGQYGEFVPMLITNALDNPMCHQGLAWAVGRLAEDLSEALTPFLPRLRQLLSSADGQVRGYGAYAFGLVDDEPSLACLEALREDSAPCRHYHLGALHDLTVGELAGLALARRLCYNGGQKS